jgi:hypothetical protein
MSNVPIQLPGPTGPIDVSPHKVSVTCTCGRSYLLTEATLDDSTPDQSTWSCPGCGALALSLRRVLPATTIHWNVGQSGIAILP